MFNDVASVSAKGAQRAIAGLRRARSRLGRANLLRSHKKTDHGSPATFEIRDYRADDRDAVVALARELQAHERQVYDRMLPSDGDPWRS
jgi:hypothetical protein